MIYDARMVDTGTLMKNIFLMIFAALSFSSCASYLTDQLSAYEYDAYRTVAETTNKYVGVCDDATYGRLFSVESSVGYSKKLKKNLKTVADEVYTKYSNLVSQELQGIAKCSDSVLTEASQLVTKASCVERAAAKIYFLENIKTGEMLNFKKAKEDEVKALESAQKAAGSDCKKTYIDVLFPSAESFTVAYFMRQ